LVINKFLEALFTSNIAPPTFLFTALYAFTAPEAFLSTLGSFKAQNVVF
jgi:hypothetical protein